MIPVRRSLRHWARAKQAAFVSNRDATVRAQGHQQRLPQGNFYQPALASSAFFADARLTTTLSTL